MERKPSQNSRHQKVVLTWGMFVSPYMHVKVKEQILMGKISTSLTASNIFTADGKNEHNSRNPAYFSLNYICCIFILIKTIYWLYSEKAMAPHFSTFAWKIPWMEEPGRLQSMGSLESDTTEQLHFHFSLSFIGERNGNPLQCSCLENPSDAGAWWAAVYGVAQSWTQLKRFCSSSSIDSIKLTIV